MRAVARERNHFERSIAKNGCTEDIFSGSIGGVFAIELIEKGLVHESLAL
jgi:hypothetical protein